MLYSYCIFLTNSKERSNTNNKGAHDKAFCFLEILAKYTIFLVIGKYDFMLSYFLFVSKLLVILLIWQIKIKI